MWAKTITKSVKLVAITAGSALLMSACYTADDGRKGVDLPIVSDLGRLINGPTPAEKEAKARKKEILQLHLTDPRRERDYARVWRHITNWTDARKLSDQRMSIRAKGKYLGNKRRSETNFFIRAAAETIRNDYDGFVIVHMDYFDVTPKLPSLTPNITLGGRRWIGNYEDFRDNMNEQNLFSDVSKAGRKTMDGVILMLNADEFPNRDRFNANEIYMNYLTYEKP